MLRGPMTGVPLLLSPIATDVPAAGRGWLMAADGAAAYPVRDGIASPTPAHRIPLTGEAARPETDERRRAVQAFYDQVGWQPGTDGGFQESGRLGRQRLLVLRRG